MVRNLVEAAGLFAAIVTLPLGVLTGMFVGFTAAAVVFVVGWFLLTPLLLVGSHEFVPLLRDRFGSSDDAAERAGESDPLAELKARYARGEIDDAEFERRVERLVGVEDIDADGPAPDDLGADGIGTAGRDRERSVERE